MAIVPKRKTSKQRKRNRRSHHALVSPSLTTCKSCSKQTLPHRACQFCGDYKGRSYPANRVR